MKQPAIPEYIDRNYVNDCVSECVLYMQRQGPWWLQRSCLNTAQSRRLISLFMLSIELWHKREAQAMHHKRVIQPNHQFNLYPLIQHVAYTLSQLAQSDEALLKPEIIETIEVSCTELQEFLQTWHQVDADQAISQSLANIS
jgi:hypothetical protein